MKIIEPYVEIVTPIDGAAVLKHIERCGRVCYKSEDRITEDSAERFIRSILRRGHESVLEHYSLTVRFVVDRGVSHEIVRHRLASYCVSGDTEIRSMSQKSWTVKQLYDWQNDPKRTGRIKLMNIRSVDESTMMVVPNKMQTIHYMGVKPVFKLSTESGRSIKCTGDHRILCKGGWKRLDEITTADSVCANGVELLENPDWLKWFYIEQNHTRKQTAEEIGCCESYVYRALKKFGIVKPLSDRPNRHPGHGVKGMFSEESKKRLSDMKRGENNHKYKQNRNSLSVSGGYEWTHRVYTTNGNVCKFCGTNQNLELHHVNKNTKDISEDNIKVLCSHCHRLWHKSGTIGVFYDKVVGIDSCGEEDVYDISMASDTHNFVANGIVVHNCQESSRYCNYANGKFGGEITVIKPCFFKAGSPEYIAWKNACQSAEDAYMEMLESGCSPEQARDVLPTSLKTELIMTANLREWRHFLKLRTDKAAHPQMREVAVPLLLMLKERIPAVFDDIQIEEEGHED